MNSVTYHLRLRESPHNPPIDITVAQTSPPSDDPLARVDWKVHSQYDNGSARQVSATFNTIGAETGLYGVLAKALDEIAKRF